MIAVAALSLSSARRLFGFATRSRSHFDGTMNSMRSLSVHIFSVSFSFAAAFVPHTAVNELQPLMNEALETMVCSCGTRCVGLGRQASPYRGVLSRVQTARATRTILLRAFYMRILFVITCNPGIQTNVPVAFLPPLSIHALARATEGMSG